MNRRNLGIAADLATIVAGLVLLAWALGADIPFDIQF